MKTLYKISRPFLFALPPEVAHSFSLKMLKIWANFSLVEYKKPVEVMGLQFPNKIGLAAGFDKNGDYIDALESLGFGCIEIGALTPKPQQGNDKPRLFRYKKEQAIINRMGFNNKGILYAIKKLKSSSFSGIIGINIGKNKNTPNENAIDDYLYCLQVSYQHCDYISINLSSPNTPNLRDLLKPANLQKLLTRLKQEQIKIFNQTKKWTPLVVKISPDMDDTQLITVAKIIRGSKMDGIIATNTTVQHSYQQTGGLSGKPLNETTTKIIKKLADLYQGDLPIIASGGIMDKKSADDKLKAGASLVQIFTGLIYRGPVLIKNIFDIC
ncbi:MAG: quinone-dependent dihydroorotate dehydrogenase [Gammaproteobacteria bacterium]|nr:MAG: quinone-dependent dihydroorotate dehydrogenase [Gammaproteobacteria bacterium]